MLVQMAMLVKLKHFLKKQYNVSKLSTKFIVFMAYLFPYL